jgi:hypothetical protein
MDPLVKRWRRGHELAAQRSRELARAAEPAVVEDAIVPPIVPDGSGPCAPESESPVQQLRRRWARIEARAKQGPTR